MKKEKWARMNELKNYVFASVEPHRVEEEVARITSTPWKRRTTKANDRGRKLAGVILRAVGAAQKAYVAELDGFVFTEKCKQRFSLCLDCDLKNKCDRYSKHLAEGLPQYDEVSMAAAPAKIVGKHIVLWRKDNRVAARVLSIEAEKKAVTYIIVLGDDAGETFRSRYEDSQTVKVFGSLADVTAAFSNWDALVEEWSRKG